MIRYNFSHSKPYRYARYGRMSSDSQNPRSPDQQFETIESVKSRLGCTAWCHVRDERDDGISGRYVQKRPGLQSLLRDIRSGSLKIDVIAVDTLERLGRAEQISEIRRELLQRYGVFVVTADSSFADPTSAAGKALGFVESFRSTEDTRIKSHNVHRGKRDSARLKKWPGGAPPFGYRLESVTKEVKGRLEVDYSRLVIDEQKAWIIRDLFQRALQTGWGCARLAEYLNAHAQIPDQFKPFKASTVNYRLRQSVYVGIYVWGRVATDVIDERRVMQHVPPEEQIVVEEFCEPLVSMETWRGVQELRTARTAKAMATRAKAQGPQKEVRPVSRGLVIKYPLTGLVRCGSCGRAMIPASSKAYQPVGTTDSRRYVGYVCPCVSGGACENKVRVPEPWLREVVTTRLLDRLAEWGSEEDLLDQLTELVRKEVGRLNATQPAVSDALRHEQRELEQSIAGWVRSLGRPDLSDLLRRELEDHYTAARQRQQEIDAAVAAEEGRLRLGSESVSRELVLERLRVLPDLLMGENATAANLHFALHLDRVEAHPGGRVVLRMCKLGLVPQATQAICEMQTEDRAERLLARARRRGRLAAGLLEGDPTVIEELMHFALDPHRFANLPENCFYIDEFEIPVRRTWPELHGAAVYAEWLATGTSRAKLAKQFGVSIPTLRNALKLGKQQADGDSAPG